MFWCIHLFWLVNIAYTPKPFYMGGMANPYPYWFMGCIQETKNIDFLDRILTKTGNLPTFDESLDRRKLFLGRGLAT